MCAYVRMCAVLSYWVLRRIIMSENIGWGYDYRLYGAKSLPEPVITHCQLDSLENTVKC